MCNGVRDAAYVEFGKNSRAPPYVNSTIPILSNPSLKVSSISAFDLPQNRLLFSSLALKNKKLSDNRRCYPTSSCCRISVITLRNFSLNWYVEVVP